MSFIQNIKDILRVKFWAPLRINYHASYYSSHSQFGEDMVIRSLLSQKNGFFVDIGAHHPVYYSNTYHFYKSGWRGVNIDANPGSMEIFNLLRNQDSNIEVCIGPEDNEEVCFWQFVSSAYNTTDPTLAKQAIDNEQVLIKKHHTKAKNINTILKQLNMNSQIDFLNIDIEGLDEIVLKSLDWEKYQPTVIAFEDHKFDIDNISNCTTLNFLREKNYSFQAKCGPTIIVKNVS